MMPIIYHRFFKSQVFLLRALKKYYTLSRLHRFQKKITQISINFQCVSYLCNRSLIGVIRDFETFSEISYFLPLPFVLDK